MEYIAFGDVVRFGITTHNPSGGALINADETPTWYAYKNDSDTVVTSGVFALRSGLTGTYRGKFTADAATGFSRQDWVEVHASGAVGGISGRAVIKGFVIDDTYNANIVSVGGSGLVINPTVNANIVSVGGSGVSLTGTVDSNIVSVNGSGVSVATQFDANVVAVSGTRVHYNDVVPTIYFAGIKFVHDGITPSDDYVVQWFKNSTPLGSGQVTNPALSVHNTSSNSSLFINKVLNYQSVSHGALRYNEVTNIAVSGEPYLAVASGTIDGATRTWTNPIGIDYLS